MITLPNHEAVFVGVPRAASLSISRWLEPLKCGEALCEAERMHHFHASLHEAAEVCAYPLFRCWSFAVVRNPFDRIVSYCAMFDVDWGIDPAGCVRRSLESPVNRWTMPQSDIVRSVKTLYRFEALDECIADIAERLSIATPLVNVAEHETDHGHYRGYFTPETRKMAESRYAQDLFNFDYGF